MRKKSSAFDRKLQGWINDYECEHGVGSGGTDLDDVAAWAVQTGRWKRPAPTPVTMCRRELSRAARNEYYLDPQGREVRTRHPVRGEQGVLWYDIRTAPPGPMHVSLQTRRRGILSDCLQCKTDVDSYNENNSHGAHLQLEFNFEPDIAEMEHPPEYPEERPLH